MSWQLHPNYDWDTLRSTYSWVEDMHQTPQDPIWHAEGDVGIHTRMVLEALMSLPEFHTLPEQEQEILKAAALLHDVEKRSTTIEDGGRILSPGHARKGEGTARDFLYKEQAVAPELREAVAKLVRYHGLPLWALEKQDPEKETIKCSLEVNTQHVALLAEADILGRTCEDGPELLERIAFFREFCRELKCYGTPRQFESNLARYRYFANEEGHPDYVPFDDTKFEVILMSGLPGTGKDTWIKRNLSKDYPVVSLDDIRRANKIQPGDKKGTGKIVQMAREQARVYMREHRSFVWNATNLSRRLRNQVISFFAEYGGRTKVVALETPWARLQQQNRDRAHVVPMNIMQRMARKWEPVQVWEAVDLVRG